MATPGSSFTPTPLGHEDNIEVRFLWFCLYSSYTLGTQDGNKFTVKFISVALSSRQRGDRCSSYANLQFQSPPPHVRYALLVKRLSKLAEHMLRHVEAIIKAIEVVKLFWKFKPCDEALPRFHTNPLGESLEPAFSYFTAKPLKKKPRYAD
ncbi:hypothetical protein TNCV_1403651 [Trichonephila clavipes]|nr:hypothetical protein TNCV_1403651 [Trichonephila clavipes]